MIKGDYSNDSNYHNFKILYFNLELIIYYEEIS